MPIDSEENWSRYFVGNFYITQSGSYAGRIEPIIVPVVFKSFCRIYTSSFGAEQRWRFAGKLIQVGGGMDLTQHSLTLDRICVFGPPLPSNLLTEYSLRIEPPKWLKHLQVVIDAFIPPIGLSISEAEIDLKLNNVDFQSIINRLDNLPKILLP